MMKVRVFNKEQNEELRNAAREYAYLSAAMKDLDLVVLVSDLDNSSHQLKLVKSKIEEFHLMEWADFRQGNADVVSAAFSNFKKVVSSRGVVAITAFFDQDQEQLLSSVPLGEFFASRGVQYEEKWKDVSQQPNNTKIKHEDDVESAYDMLSPYFESKDLRALDRCLRDADGNDREFYPGAINRSLHILGWLREGGYEYSLHPNQVPGKLRVSVDGTQINIRVLDACIDESGSKTREQAMSDAREGIRRIGRVSDRGNSYYFSRDGSPGSLGFSWEPTRDEVLAPMQFALGLTGAPGAYYVANQPSSGQGRVHVALGGGAHRKFIVELDKAQGLPFGSPEEAEAFLRGSISSARLKYKDTLQLDEIIRCVELGEDFHVSDDEDLARQQMAFYSLALQAQGFDEIGELAGMDAESGIMDSGSPLYSFAHIDADFDSDMVNMLAGQRHSLEGYVEFGQGWQVFVDSYADAWLRGNMDSFERGFNPAAVARSMQHGTSYMANSDLLVAAMKTCRYDISKIHDSGGMDWYVRQIKDKSLSWDYKTARTADGIVHPFGKEVLNAVKETLEGTGIAVEPGGVSMDEQGIIFWEGMRTAGEKNPQPEKISGMLGQVFLPDDTGSITTLFGGTPNYEAIPGYRAYLTPASGGGDFRSRHRLRGYEQIMLDAVRHQVRHDALASHVETRQGTIDNVTALNRVYGHLYEDRFGFGELDEAERAGDLPSHFADAVKSTLAGRIRYSNFYKNSTTNADARRRLGMDKGDATHLSAFDETGGRNLRVLSEDMDGIFCKDGSPSGNINQGLVRYLAEGASVNADGTLEAGDGDFCALLNLPEFRNKDYNPWNRTSMALMQSLAPPRRVIYGASAAMMSMGGFNMDDGFVVSREFAEENMIKVEYKIEEIIDGKMVVSTKERRRPLQRGDKISDFNGNKGVIGLIVDRHRTAGEQSLPGMPFPEEAVRIFKDNPDLDVVMSPYSLISRGNAGLAREMMESPSDLSLGGKVYEGGIGRVSFMVTNKTVDENSSIYEYDDLAQGKGRKFSATLSMGLMSAGCSKIVESVFGGNQRNFENYREYLIAVGLDVRSDGILREGYAPHIGENRKIFRIEDSDTSKHPVMHEDFHYGRSVKANVNPKYTEANGYSFSGGDDYGKVLYKSHNSGEFSDTLVEWPVDSGPRQAFAEAISGEGGFLEVPWPLEFYSEQGSGLPPLICQETETLDGGKAWLAPIIAPGLREAQEMRGGETMYHNFTRQYGIMYEQVYNYKINADKIARREAQLAEAEVFASSELGSLGLDLGAYSARYASSNESERSAILKEVKRLIGGARAASGAQPQPNNSSGKIPPDPLYAAWRKIVNYPLEISEYKKNMDVCRLRAQAAFGKVSREIADYYVNGNGGKGSYLRENVMGRRMPLTGTLVCIPDPRLPLGSVSMNRESMKSFGLSPGSEGNQLLVWRDPIIKDGGIRYMDVVEDHSIAGIGINPAVAASFGMDFDGDSVGVMRLTDSAAVEEAKQKLTPVSHLLNTGVKEVGKHPLYFNFAQDVAMFVHEHGDKPAAWDENETKGITVKSRLKEITEKLNSAAALPESSDIDVKDAYREIGIFVRCAFKGSWGASPLRFSSAKALYKDLSYIVESGAKGNQAKLDEFCRNMGITISKDGNVFDMGRPPGDLREKAGRCQRAVAMKADDTGLAGSFKQALMGSFMDVDPKTVLEVTEPVTQGVLSIKDSEEHAMRIDKLLRKDLTNLIKHGTRANEIYPTSKNASRIGKDEFSKELIRVFTDKETGMGLKINQDYVHKLADMMSDGGGKIRKLSTIEGNPLARVSYNVDGRQSLAKLRELAAKSSNLFEGRNSNCFTPVKIREDGVYACLSRQGVSRVKKAVGKGIAVNAGSEIIAKTAGIYGSESGFSKWEEYLKNVENDPALREYYEVDELDGVLSGSEPCVA